LIGRICGQERASSKLHLPDASSHRTSSIAIEPPTDILAETIPPSPSLTIEKVEIDNEETMRNPKMHCPVLPVHGRYVTRRRGSTSPCPCKSSDLVPLAEGPIAAPPCISGDHFPRSTIHNGWPRRQRPGPRLHPTDDLEPGRRGGRRQSIAAAWVALGLVQWLHNLEVGFCEKGVMAVNNTLQLPKEMRGFRC